MALIALNVALAALLAGAIAKDRMADASRRDQLARQMGAAGLSEADRAELYAQKVGDALRLATIDSEPVARGGQVQLGLSNGEGSACALSLQLERADTGQVLLRTGLLDPGYRLETAKLDAELAPGQYQCQARLSFYEDREGLLVGTAVRLVLLRVE